MYTNKSLYIVFVLCNGYVEFRTSELHSGSNPTTHHNKSWKQVVEELVKFYMEYYSTVSYEVIDSLTPNSLKQQSVTR